MNKQKGITLVSLVITIIVMLILAGVSLNMVMGDNSVLLQAQKSAFIQKMAGYKEELALSYLGSATKQLKSIKKEEITVMGEYVKEYIPSIAQEDIGKYAIVKGDLYYCGSDEIELLVCKEQGYVTLPADMDTEKFNKEIEKNALASLAKKLAGDGFFEQSVDDSGNKVGVKLSNRTLVNPDWKIITEVVNDEVKSTYAENWYFVEKGVSVPNIGVLSKSYIINYKDGEAVEYDPTIHTMLSKTSNLSVTDSIVLNIDSTLFDGELTGAQVLSNVPQYLGPGVELHNVSESFVGHNTIELDGIDDIMTIKSNYNLSHLAENGFCFEYYGKVAVGETFKHTNGVHYDYGSGGILATYDTIPGNSIWSSYTNIRVKYSNSGIVFSCGKPDAGISDFSGTEAYKNNQHYNTSNFRNFAPAYVQVVFDPKTTYTVDRVEYISQKCFINGEKKYEGKFCKTTWDSFIAGNTNEFYWEIGRMNGADHGGVNAYSKLSARAIRLYGRAITDEEAKLNYNATVSYYELVNGSITGGSENDNGDDLGNVQ